MNQTLYHAQAARDIVDRLSRGDLRRDPDAKPWRVAEKPPALIVPFEDRQPLRVPVIRSYAKARRAPVSVDAIIQCIRQHPGETMDQIGERIGYPKGTLPLHFTRLLKSGAITRSATRPYHYTAT